MQLLCCHPGSCGHLPDGGNTEKSFMPCYILYVMYHKKVVAFLLAPSMKSYTFDHLQ